MREKRQEKNQKSEINFYCFGRYDNKCKYVSDFILLNKVKCDTGIFIKIFLIYCKDVITMTILDEKQLKKYYY
jgi:hypothetical protein